MDEDNQDKQYLLDKRRWIGELNEAYHKIVTDPAYGSRVLDDANEAICDALQKIEILVKTRRNG
jgi:hypothetical protein